MNFKTHRNKSFEMSDVPGLTGGTHDINPQYLSGTLTQTGVDITTTAQITIPIDRLRSGTTGHIGCFEVLRVYFVFRGGFALLNNADQKTASFTTKSFGVTTVQFNEPTCFARCDNLITFVTSGAANVYQPFQYDCTDGNGHGVLIATDSIFIQVASSSSTVAVTCDYKILYRYKNVPIQEYVGIVQSQS